MPGILATGSYKGVDFSPVFSINRARTDEQANKTTRALQTASQEASVPDEPRSDDVAVSLRALGLPPTANWDEIATAHRRLVSDLTPGPDASHRNVELAERFLREVNEAYASLQILSVA